MCRRTVRYGSYISFLYTSPENGWSHIRHARCCHIHVQRTYKLDRYAVLRILDVYPGSEFFPSRIGIRIFPIPDTGSEFLPSWICIKKLKILTQKTVSKLSRNTIRAVSCRIRILIFSPSRNPRSKRHRFPDPQHCRRYVPVVDTMTRIII